MAKIFNYSIFLTGMILLLNLSGVTTITSQLLNAISSGNLTQIANSPIMLVVIAIFGLGSIGAIVAGIYTKQSTESIIVASLASLLLAWSIADIVSIISYMNTLGLSWLSNIITLIFVPLLVGYFIAIVQWWRGNDI